MGTLGIPLPALVQFGVTGAAPLTAVVDADRAGLHFSDDAEVERQMGEGMTPEAVLFSVAEGGHPDSLQHL